MPQTENFYIYTVLDGSVRLFTPSGIMDYISGQFSVSKIDTPMSGHALTFSENGYFLALVMEFTLNDVISVLLDLDGNLAEQIGSQFLQSIINIQQAGEIYEINSWIKENFRNSFTVEELAEKRNMRVSLFHQKFKSAVGMAPLQCQKRLRLTEARRLMLNENRNVTDASLDVGYESVRDYRKMFGLKPKEGILRLRSQLKK